MLNNYICVCTYSHTVISSNIFRLQATTLSWLDLPKIIHIAMLINAWILNFITFVLEEVVILVSCGTSDLFWLV